MNTLPDHQNHVLSDTGEIFRDWENGLLIIDSSKSQGAVGKIGNKRIKLMDAVLDIKTPNASVLLTSLDGQDLKHSQEVLISTAARVREVKSGKWHSVESEIVSGQIELFSECRDLKMRPLLSGGKRGQAIPVRYTGNDSCIIDLPEKAQTHWFVFENSRSTRASNTEH